MPPPVILDLAQIDTSKVVLDKEAILAVNPHRFEFALLDAVVYCNKETGIYAGYHDVREDAWWIRGHIPSRPLLPGVLMIEAAAQLASVMAKTQLPIKEFIGFTGVEDVRFRGVVTPPCRLLIVGKSIELKTRRIISAMQSFVNGTMVFEGRIIGMPV